MKINFPTLFQTPLETYRFFFIFGNDLEIFERSISFLTKTLKKKLKEGDEKNIDSLSLAQPSLFEATNESPLFYIPNVSDKILKSIDSLKEGHFIFTSQKARAKSKLVTHFTNSRESLAIAAYAAPISTSEFAFLAQGMDIPESFKPLLLKAYQNDYMGFLSVLEKICLYGDVSEDKYESFLTASSNGDDMKPLLEGLLLRNKEKTVSVLSLLTPTEMISFLRTLSRSFQILLELKEQIKTNHTPNWFKLTTPVFFKDQSTYESALKLWTPQALLSGLKTLLNLENKIKYEGISAAIVKETLLGISI